MKKTISLAQGSLNSCFMLINAFCTRSMSLIVGLLLFFALSSCEEAALLPKPRAYPKVEYPDKAYQSFGGSDCPFTFEYPTYTRIEKAKPQFEGEIIHPCWFDVFYPQFDGRIYFSYYPLDAEASLDDLRRQTFEMVNWHNKRANYIDEIVINRPGVSGLAFDIQGPAATPFQFYLTDSEKHYIHASLYFNTEARPDSLAPVTEFVMEDVLKIIETIEWTE